MSVHMHRFFDILVCRFRLFCEYHMDVVITLHAPLSALHAVGVEHEDERTFMEALIVAQHVHQKPPRTLDIHLRKLP